MRKESYIKGLMKNMESKEDWKCVICGRTLEEQNSWKRCPARDNGHICEFHCFHQCQYLNQEISLAFCTYNDRKKKGQ